MRTGKRGGQRTTSMADPRDERALRRDAVAGDPGGDRMVPPGSVHAAGVGGDGAPLASGASRGKRDDVRGDRGAHGSLDDDGDAGGALASPRRGRLSRGARAAGGDDVERLSIALPVKGRLREPSVSLLEDAGLGPEEPGERALA